MASSVIGGEFVQLHGKGTRVPFSLTQSCVLPLTRRQSCASAAAAMADFKADGEHDGLRFPERGFDLREKDPSRRSSDELHRLTNGGESRVGESAGQ